MYTSRLETTRIGANLYICRFRIALTMFASDVAKEQLNIKEQLG